MKRKRRSGKGNIPINKELAKRTEDGKVVQDLPLVEVNGEMLPLFTVISQTLCPICGHVLNVSEHYTRHIISSFGIIACPVVYWKCSNEKCDTPHHDTIVGVTGSANYSDEFLEKQKWVRYDGKCSLWNTRSVGEIYTDGLTDTSGRAPCPTTLWKHEQEEGKKSYDELIDLDVPFNGTLHIDGYWVKDGWRVFIEEQLGRELTNREWKRLRYKVIYVAATEDKVILDFEITNIMPSYLELVPLMNRLKHRLTEERIEKVVSDEDYAIIDSVSRILPNAVHSFCVFHQLMNVTKKYLDEFGKLEQIPKTDKEIYELAQELILSENAIESTILLKRIFELSSNKRLSKASRNVINYVEEIYHKNRKILEKGFIPETNNVMEQLFSLIDDFFYQARSFKTTSGLKNFFSNLAQLFNNRAFNTGKWRGLSPIERAMVRLG